MSYSMKNVLWIGARKGEDSPFITEKWSKEREERLKSEITVEKSSRLFRKRFSVSDKVEKATLQISGLGFYEVYINGVKPDEKRVFTPVISDYFLLTRYDVYDVTALICQGQNAICAEVGPGWYAGTPEFWGWQQFWYGNLRLAARLEVLTDKGETVFLTDESWKTTKGAITESCVYNGEKWNFNLLPSGWTDAEFDDGSWNNAAVVKAPTENLVMSIVPPERIIRTLDPVESWKTEGGKTMFDFGENGAGIPRVTVIGKRGDVVRLEHSEYLTLERTLNKKSLNRAASTDEFILADNKPTVCMPKFSWHGYQFMTVETSSPDVKIISAEKCVVHTDVKTAGVFKCGNTAFNKLHEGYVRTELSCLQGVPVDCPQRDERKAWLGDAHVTSEMCVYNFDMKDLYASFLDDMKTGRPKDTKVVSFLCPCYNVEATKVGKERTSIDWNMAYPVILWEHYKRYGDKKILVHHYKALKEHTDYYVKQLKDGFIPPCWFGDWLTFDYPENTVNRVAFAAGPDYHRQNPPYAATLFFCATLNILISVAKVLGEKDDAEYYSSLLEKSKKAILNKYYDAETGILGGGGQFLQAYSLYEHIMPEKDREKVFLNLLAALEETKYHLLCGIFTRVLFDVLCHFNRRDIVYKILSQNGYMCPQHFLEGGRTTLTESYDWDGSGCHCMWASPDASLYKVFGGITIDRTKTPAVEISPYFVKELGFVNCKQKIEEGEISVTWKYLEKGVSLDVSTPVESTLVLPNGKTEILPVGNYNFIIEE